MADVRERYSKLFGRGEGTDRIQFFSDAVFAIAMTLLVLDIRLPPVADDSQLLGALLNLWPEYFAYVLSFLIIAIRWFSHHRTFRVIERYDTRLIWINLLLLLIIAFVPFPTSLLSEYGPETPVVVLYAATVSALSLVQWWIWAHARRAGLLGSNIDDGLYRVQRAGLIPGPVVFGLSIIVALWQPLWAMYAWIVLWPLSFAVDRVVAHRIDRRDAAAGAAGAAG